MPILNYTSKEITVKIVYYGPALSGKTTNVKYIARILPQERKGKMVTLPTKEDRTLFFDFLPFSLGGKAGYKIRLQLYTVPGQVIYDSTRRLVLQGADGVVFVADSQKALLENDIESLENMKANLKKNGLNYYKIPLVLQYNKRDLPNILSVEKLDDVLNELSRPSVPAIAIRGEGVVETLAKIAELTLKDLQSKYAVLEDMNIDALIDELRSFEGKEKPFEAFPIEELPEEIPEEAEPFTEELPEETMEEQEAPEVESIISAEEETEKRSREEFERFMEEAGELEEAEELPEEEVELEEVELSPSPAPEQPPQPPAEEGPVKEIVKEIPLNISVKEGEEIELILKFKIKVKKSGNE